jgi:hypothetical protein
MKNFKIAIFAVLIISSIISCKKDTTDERDKFIGTWIGIINSIVPGMGSNTSKLETLTITKGTASNEINLTQTGSTLILTANVSSSNYTYVEYTQSATGGGITVSTTYDGTGTLNGFTITESGTLTYTIAGTPYPGTWSSTLDKQ